jgi:hypothetical protein
MAKMSGMMGMKSGVPAGPNFGGRGGMGMDLPSAPGQEPDAKKPKGSHWRTEFVIFFVWKEPTSLTTASTIEDDSSTAAAGGMGMGGGR